MVDVAGAGRDGLAAGRLVVRDAGGSALLAHPFAAATAAPAPLPLGPLTLQRDGDRVTGVRFTLGAFERGDPLGAATGIALTERIALTLVEQRGERAVRRLTPPGGARELLPAEYAYELPARRAARAAPRALRLPRGRVPAARRRARDRRSEPFQR